MNGPQLRQVVSRDDDDRRVELTFDRQLPGSNPRGSACSVDYTSASWAQVEVVLQPCRIWSICTGGGGRNGGAEGGGAENGHSVNRPFVGPTLHLTAAFRPPTLPPLLV